MNKLADLLEKKRKAKREADANDKADQKLEPAENGHKKSKVSVKSLLRPALITSIKSLV